MRSTLSSITLHFLHLELETAPHNVRHTYWNIQVSRNIKICRYQLLHCFPEQNFLPKVSLPYLTPNPTRKTQISLRHLKRSSRKVSGSVWIQNSNEDVLGISAEVESVGLFRSGSKKSCGALVVSLR